MVEGGSSYDAVVISGPYMGRRGQWSQRRGGRQVRLAGSDGIGYKKSAYNIV